MALTQAAGHLFADGPERHAACGGRSRPARRSRKSAYLGLERTSVRLAIRTRVGEDRCRLLRCRNGCAESIARRRNAVHGARHDVRPRLLGAVDQPHIDIQFLPKLEGYIWVFPRAGHLSVGICGKGESAQCLRARLERYMDEKGIPRKEAKFYGHMLPALESRGWRNNRLAGDGWIAVGDAGGLVDPITGEGLYYAVRSGDLASQVVLADRNRSKEETLPAVDRARFWPGPDLRRRTGEASLLRSHLFRGSAEPHDRFHEAQSEILRDYAGSVCRNAALSGVEDQAPAQREYDAARNLHELSFPQADSRRNAGMNVRQSEASDRPGAGIHPGRCEFAGAGFPRPSAAPRASSHAAKARICSTSTATNTSTTSVRGGR